MVFATRQTKVTRLAAVTGIMKSEARFRDRDFRFSKSREKKSDKNGGKSPNQAKAEADKREAAKRMYRTGVRFFGMVRDSANPARKKPNRATLTPGFSP